MIIGVSSVYARSSHADKPAHVDRRDDLAAQVDHADNAETVGGHVGERHDLLDLVDPIDRDPVALARRGRRRLRARPTRSVPTLVCASCSARASPDGRSARLAAAPGSRSEPQNAIELIDADRAVAHLRQPRGDHGTHPGCARRRLELGARRVAGDVRAHGLGERQHLEDAGGTREAALAAVGTACALLASRIPFSAPGNQVGERGPLDPGEQLGQLSARPAVRRPA